MIRVSGMVRAGFAALVLFVAGNLSPAVAAADKAWPIDHVLGNPNAPITIIEYASLTCPHCAAFAEEVFPKLKAEWLDTGKAKLIYRDFPTDIGAQAAALIVHCSGDRYFSFLETLFHRQDQWKRSSNPMASLKALAMFGGMPGDAVDKCFADTALLNQIQARMQEGEKTYAINSTPSFIINGKLLEGALPYDQFVQHLK